MTKFVLSRRQHVSRIRFCGWLVFTLETVQCHQGRDIR